MQEEHSEVSAKLASEKAKSPRVFGHARKPAKMFRAGLYARVSTNDQQTIPLQMRALREYAARRGWTIAMQVKEVGSGASQRQLREKFLDAARRREVDVVLVWRIAGRCAPVLAVFAEFERDILRERVRTGLAHARQNGKKLGRPITAGLHTTQVRKLHRAGISKAEIARRLEIGRTSVRRILETRS